MFEFTRNFYDASGGNTGSEPTTFAPGQIIIPEQTVDFAGVNIGIDVADIQGVPDKLLIKFDGVEYIVEKAIAPWKGIYYGEVGENMEDLIFTTYPFFIIVKSDWRLRTRLEGIHTISAKIPEEKSPKVLSFPKGRTIVSELSRLNKAFGTISKKKTIIGQLSDIAEAAEAGKIGGGSGEALMVRVNGTDIQVLDKTWQEIYDALKITSVYIITETEDDEGMSVSTNRRLVGAWYSDGTYQVNDDNSAEYTTDSSDGYPKRVLQLNPGAGEML